MEYPKMLYTGDTKHYQHIIADDAEHEAELKEQGYTDYADLKVWTGNAGAVSSSGDGVSPIDPKSDELSEKVVNLELQLNVAQTERDENIAEVARLNSVIEAGQAENIALQVKLDSHEQKSADLTVLTSDQLREMLDAKGVAYLARDNKETLINLLEGSNV